jgi:hypothetical protein
MAGPCIIPQPFPSLEYGLQRGGGQRGDIWKSRKETTVIWDYLLHARLLKHQLRNPDAVRRPPRPPRQATPMPREPGQETRDNGLSQWHHGPAIYSGNDVA